LSSEDGAGDRI